MNTYSAVPLALALSASAAFGQATLNEAARATESGRPKAAAVRFGTDYRAHLDTWWQDAVFYEIFVRSFADSTTGPLANDGVGDLRGIIERLDYLNDGDPTTDTDLGITALWLMPVTQSPSYHGYDTVDYRTIDDEYGTNDDFRELIAECDQRGIRVVIDLVINHSSSDHPWFLEAREPGSDKRDWYIWRDEHPGWQGAWGQNVWHPSLSNDGSWYFGLFWKGMPDLNFDHEPVTQAVFDMTRYWVEDMGVAGFRLDAIRHLIEDGQIQENTPATHAWLKRFHEHLQSLSGPTAAPGEVFTVGEVWSDSDAVSRYVGDQIDVCFEFDLGYRLVDAVNQQSARPIVRQLEKMDIVYPLGMYATFIRNHDQPRTLHELGGDREAAALAAVIQFCLPGVPFIYYGEEIGMTGTKPDEFLRTPMQWAPPSEAGPGVGFTNTTPWMAANIDAEDIHVAGQEDDPRSLLNTYRRLIALRHAEPALKTGELRLIETGHESVLAWERSANGRRLLCLFNLSDRPVRDYRLNASGRAGADLLGAAAVTGDTSRPLAELAARSAWVIELD